MGLLELCLLSLMSPQAPTAPAPAASAAAAVAAPTTAPAASSNDRDALVALERAGDKAPSEELVRLASVEDPAIAARAAWILARGKDATRVEPLQRVVAGSPHATARAQALQGLLRHHDVSSTATAIAALDDGDRTVRTLAAELLGKLRRPTAIEPLLAVLDRARSGTQPGPATDLQAALLALHDLGASEHLLRAATAIQDGKAEDTGAALTFLLQGLAGKLDPARQQTLALALLDHRELLVRRFAIGRLAELGQPSAASALEGRLAKEGDELRPLVEVALAQVRKDDLQPPTDELERALHNARAIQHATARWWQKLSPVAKGGVVAAPVLLITVLWLLARRRRAAAAAASAAATVALVQPSEEYVEQMAEEAEQLAAEAEQVAEADAEAEASEELETHGAAR
jgi:hypothetical protein